MPAKPPLLLLHGFTGTPSAFAPLLARLSDFETTRSPALVGHDGRDRSGAPADDSFTTECDRIAAVARTLAPVHVVGYSLGARIALGAIARHPALFRGATLIGLHPGLSDPEQRRDRVAADEVWCQILERKGLEAFVDAWQAQPLFASQATLPQEAIARQRRERLTHHPMGLAYSLRATGLGKMPDLSAVLDSDVWGHGPPIELVVGGLDAKFVTLAARYASRRSVLVVEGAGHNVLLERPEVVADAVYRGATTVRRAR